MHWSQLVTSDCARVDCDRHRDQCTSLDIHRQRMHAGRSDQGHVLVLTIGCQGAQSVIGTSADELAWFVSTSKLIGPDCKYAVVSLRKVRFSIHSAWLFSLEFVGSGLYRPRGRVSRLKSRYRDCDWSLLGQNGLLAKSVDVGKFLALIKSHTIHTFHDSSRCNHAYFKSNRMNVRVQWNFHIWNKEQWFEFWLSNLYRVPCVLTISVVMISSGLENTEPISIVT